MHYVYMYVYNAYANSNANANANVFDRLQHVDTNSYLSVNKKYEFGSPIPGQLEVHTVSSTSTDNVWMAQEGLYFSNAY